MRRTFLGTLGVLAAAVMMTTALDGSQARSLGAPPPDRATIEKALIANERKVADAIVKGDVKSAQALIPSDAWSVDPMGAMPVSEFFKLIGSGQLKISAYNLSDYKFVWADANTAVLTYTWTGKGTFNGQPIPEKAFSSTVWTRRPSGWMAIFHQESLTLPPGK
jgi:hypothetical protein